MIPSDIPKVRVVDEHGKQCYEGYYFQMEEYTPSPICDGERKPVPIVQCVVISQMMDWGLPNGIRVIRVTPPHRIEVIEPMLTLRRQGEN